MALEACPDCGKSFDSQRHCYTVGYFQVQWPSEQIDKLFTVRCPHCGATYVSSSVKFLGLTRNWFWPLWLVAAILIGVVITYPRWRNW
jgi:endogenous inhibitor of DNA gyrase (YacG/DUF329 family)